MSPRVYLLARNPTDSVRDGFLPAAARLGTEVTVLTDDAHRHRSATPGVPVVPCDVEDFREVLSCIARLGPADAVLTNSDHLQTQAALAAAFLDLPGKPWRATVRTRDKAVLRRRLAATGADQVWARELGRDEDPAGLNRPDQRPVPFPVVVKPREGVASEDVFLVHDRAGLERRCREIRGRRPGAALVVEEYLPGTLRTLETLGDGRVRHVLGGFETELSEPPHFIETRMRFVPEPPADEAEQVLTQLDALGVGFGACHTEYVVDATGRARIIEVNYRAIGDHCDLLLAELLDLPLFELILLTHLGHPLPAHLDLRTDRRARVAYACARTGGVLTAAPGPCERDEDGTRLRYRPLRALGERHPHQRTNRDYLGVVTVTGTEQESVDRAASRFLAQQQWVISA